MKKHNPRSISTSRHDKTQDLNDPNQPWQNRLTLKDIAKIAGVSPITVSRALHQPDLVKPETAALVLSVVDRMGYIPNQLAGGLASSRTKLVAAIVPQISHSIYLEIIQGLTDRLWARGYHVLLGLSGFDTGEEETLISAILRHRPDGIMLTGIHHSPTTRQRLLQVRLPVVETWDMTSTPIDMLVGFSHETAGRSIAQFLLKKGYRNFGVISARNERADLRLKGVMDELAGSGVSAVPVHTNPVPSSLQAGRAGAAELLSGHKIDALICSSDVLAQGAVAEAQSRNLRIPEQVAIMGFGDFDFAPHTFPALSSVRVGGRAIGAKAADMLLQKMSGGSDATSIFDSGFEIIERAST